MDRERASLRAHARVARSGPSAAASVPVADADRRGEGLHGRRRPRRREGRRLRRRRRAASSRPADVPADAAGGREGAAREKLVEMVAESDEELMEEFFEKGTLPAGGARRRACGSAVAGRAGSSPCCPPRRCATSACTPLLDAIVDLLPSPADRGEVDGHRPATQAEAVAQARRRRAAVGVRLEDDRRSVRRPHHAVPRRTRARSSPTPPSTTRRRDVGRARRARSLLLQGKTQTAGAGDQGRRPRRRGQAQGHADRRHARRQGAARSSTRRSSSPSRSSPSPSSRRRAATRTRSRTALHRLDGGGPGASASRRDPQTHELLLSGMGQLHIEVVGRAG